MAWSVCCTISLPSRLCVLTNETCHHYYHNYQPINEPTYADAPWPLNYWLHSFWYNRTISVMLLLGYTTTQSQHC